MKSLVLAVLLFPLAGSLEAQSLLNSLELVSSELTIDIEKKEIFYGDFATVQSGQFSMPVGRYLISLEENSSISAITVDMGEKQIVARASDRALTRPGQSAAKYLREYEISPITIADQRYALISIFPVTFDSAQNLVFSKSFQIRIDGVLLNQRQLAASKTKLEFMGGAETSAEEEAGSFPDSYLLYQNYPNPFNPITTIAFDLPGKSLVKLSIFNITGRKVAVIVERELAAGQYKFEWDGLDHNGQETASGIYFYKFESEKFTAVKKMILLR